MYDDTVVKMENITMEFPGVKALDNVNFETRKGEVHVLLGENGAGKSTLMKILTGVYKQTSGKIFLKGQPYEIHSIKDAEEKGVSMIFQELNLVPYLSVAENIFLGREPRIGIQIDWGKINRDAQVLLNNLGVNIDARTIVKNLTIAQQQMVEIAKALSFNPDVIIMDEPTSSLTEREIEELFKTIRDLKAKGVCIIYISHRMEELLTIGDRVTVLRDGQYVGTVNVKDTTIDQLIQMMVGRSLKEKFPKEYAPVGEESIRVCNLSQGKRLKDVSFYARKGEVVGFAGLMGAGRTELMRAIFGADPIDKGDIYIHGTKVNIKSPKDAIKCKIGFLTEDRKHQGLVLKLDVKQNITLSNLEKITKNTAISFKKEKELCEKLVNNLNIKTPSLFQKVKFLSGGNQQKVVLAKWLATQSDILIIDEPTRGIDVGAKVEIYKLMNQLTKNGATVIMVSSELPEVLGMSDRVYVMHEGKITGELTRDEATQEKILHFATGGK
ncbi:MAG: ribose transport system ATP-binding protein [Petroclostridium sp.]|jgi:ribose transport system ATP-binding protein|uniref:sugar ABC transporter ATP-binding protein n=1 Tax=Petroclostridium xylanilyticum TaxID=1792311 RepID=UPI000B9941A9|nr:sugar ABC transporter ATP-binding protein [Petroclostridium xylanilyticum]MBZ4645515.1 rbsA [Clostridia bacterium]MDK2810850.1 ribose transport system ATP-binding protein [Petroclostridium sp.]